MKCTVKRADLVKALQKVKPTINARSKIEILRCVHLYFHVGGLNITGTDLDKEVSIHVETSGKMKGRYLINHLTLSRAVASMDTEITLEPDENELILRLSDGIANLSLVGDNEADFPHMWKITRKIMAQCDEGIIDLSMTEQQWCEFFKHTTFCISNEPTRYYLNGLFLTKNGNKQQLLGVSTDGHRMAVIAAPRRCRKKFEGILPFGTIKALQKVLDPKSENMVSVTFSWGSQRMSFETGDARISTKLIDGTFPDYTRVIPKYETSATLRLNQATLNRFKFMASMSKRPFGNGLDISANHITLTAPNFGHLVMPADISVDEISQKYIWRFNANYMIEQSKITPEFVCDMSNPANPITIRSEGVNGFWILMPMRRDDG